MNSVRTCIICRKKAHTKELMPLCLNSGFLKLAISKRDRIGRGLWICTDTDCLDKFVTKPIRYMGGKLTNSIDSIIFIKNSVSELKQRVEEFKRSGNTNLCKINGLEKRLSIFQTVCEGRRMP
ncbi:DUF448 domain-containing protein [Myxococcota bacterium]|nr:DUF448 domain-containing protein [Myxococcota bacterium]MBU1381098.1 DUF448 domain-containing protein [Myxococcota bacterium]MBU1498223.1 DUF448 domain-containing protein [Myxococcota bacterium]